MLAFTTDRDGNSEVYVIDLEDGSEKNLTMHPANEGTPKWSPLGTGLAFVSNRSGQRSLYASVLDGSDPVLISEIDGLDWAWSPDERRIAWVQHNDVKDLMVTDLQAGSTVNLTNGTGDVWHPSWSPDGRFILLEGLNDEGAIHVFRISAEGGVAINLTAGLPGGREPQWSPDGAHIAFESIDWDTGGVYMYVMNADGTAPRVLTDDTEEQYREGYGAIAWSPDGSKLAYAKQYGFGPNLWVDFYVIDVNGGEPTPLDVHGQNGGPSWSPNGTRIAIVVGTGESELSPREESVVMVDPDGADMVNLTASLSVDETRSLSWSPDGSHLAFDSLSGPNSAVYVVEADGTNPVEVAVGSRPDWKPAAERGVGLVDPETGLWYLEGVTAFYFGVPGDIPVLGDWDCNGTATPGVWRSSSGLAYLRNSLDTGIADETFYFGVPGDIPLAGDWDGDGCDSLGVYRRGAVFLRNTLDTGVADIEYYFGIAGDRPLVGDFDADAIDEIGLYRQSSGLTYLKMDHNTGAADVEFLYGTSDDHLIAGDWNGNGIDTVGVFRPADYKFYLRNDNSAGFADDEFWMGHPTWIPVAGS